MKEHPCIAGSQLQYSTLANQAVTGASKDEVVLEKKEDNRIVIWLTLTHSWVPFIQVVLPDDDHEVLELLYNSSVDRDSEPLWAIEEARLAYFRRRDSVEDEMKDHTGELPSVGGV